MPEMKDGESQSDWMKRCVPVRIKEGDKQDQAVAVCLSMYRAKHKAKALLFDDVIKAGRVSRADRELERDRINEANKESLENWSPFEDVPLPTPDPRSLNDSNDLEGMETDEDRDEFEREERSKATYVLPGPQLVDTSNIYTRHGGMAPLSPLIPDDAFTDDSVQQDEDEEEPDELLYEDQLDDMEMRAKLFDDMIKDATMQSGHVVTALGNDRKRRQLQETMATKPKKDSEEESIEGEIVDKRRWKLPLKILKADPDQRLIFGWASVVEKDGVPIIDKQGDIIPVAELERASYEYVLNSRDGGDMHERRGTSRLVASLVTTPDIQKAFGFTTDQVGWIVGFYVDDDQLWEAHKRGERPEFSIAGRAAAVEVDVFEPELKREAGRARRHARRPF